MSHKLVKIGDHCDQLRGVSYAKSDSSLTPKKGLLPILRANNITEHGLDFKDLVYVPKDKIKIEQFVKKGDVLIAASSGSIDIVGKAANAINDFEGGFGAFCKLLRPNSMVDPNYFANFFKTKKYRSNISNLAAGANIYNLRNKYLDNLEIPLPPLEEQKRIAAILDKADSLRDKRRQAIAKLDELLQSVFLDMFGDPVTNPKGWEVSSLQSFTDPTDKINYGVVQPGESFQNGRPLVRVGDFENGLLKLDQMKKIDPIIESNYSRSRLKGNELLISCVGSVGTICEIPNEAIGFNIARAVTRVPISNISIRPFLLECLRSSAAQRFFKEKTRTVSQPTLNVGFVKETPVLDPPIDLKLKFVDIYNSIREKKNLFWIR